MNKCERCGEVNPAEIHTCTPKREWQDLTDEEIIDCWNDLMIFEELALDEELAVSRAIEAKLKEKNDG
jgi:hypothetical protein